MLRDDPALPAPERDSARLWALRGMRAAVSIPALILTAAFIGYAGLARESGLSLGETLAMTGLIWALPSIVVLTGALSAGMGLVPAAIAVALASVRLMPMTMALLPLLRDEGRTRRWQLLVASHFVAVTAWVHAMRTLPELPRAGRLPFFLGFASSLTGFVFCVTGVAYLLIERMPALVAAALFLLTPVYFLCSLWGAARVSADKAAMVAGVLLGPVFYALLPGLDLLWTGLAAGTLAYGATRVARRGWR
ncbi:AzlC family ABC transporter permease [Polymorphum gilvum]|uniref:AzlC protein n=1 Tax=Polymorphum gilvum (strain LMG 25793 / CGMCC 1.9160 / SL003B-26A1) TaxID=991905 RepID=F2IVX2_POLGS|nr:AzlC family ABC transporter permease [Polymorphum gilvum]ADZ70254.1 AzlC protein [Polymorphum gilvum SL003B-26A1]